MLRALWSTFLARPCFPPIKKLYFISLKALKQQFSKMEDSGNISVPESFFSTPATTRKV